MRGQQEGTCGRVRPVEVAPGAVYAVYIIDPFAGPARLLGTVDPAKPAGA
jgi:hypothetical protein